MSDASASSSDAVPATEAARLRPLYAGIALIAGATLLLEVSLTRIFSVLFFSQPAFLIVSTALFGFGLSGVVLALVPALGRGPLEPRLATLAAIFSVTTVAATAVVLHVPLQFSRIGTDTRELVNLGIYYLALGVPFFFSGLAVALLLQAFPRSVNTLYFFDLVGAGVGCMSVLFVVPRVGGSGAILLAAVLAAASGLLFARNAGPGPRRVAAAALVLTAGTLVFGRGAFEVIPHEDKRDFLNHWKKGWIELTRWSAVSRIDIAAVPGRPKKLWIDAGTNESEMWPFDGQLDRLTPSPGAGAIYRMKPNADVLIVGPAGGYEVLWALSYRPASITGVELDPVIVKVVQKRYREYLGGIYNLEQPPTRIVNDEGRSFIRRSGTRYDIIQQVNNASPQAIASGALNVSETYLLTVEALHEYYDHLEDDGWLYVRRWGTVRLGAVVAQMLRERGIERPEDHVVIVYEGDPYREGFYFKRSAVTPADLAVFDEFVASHRGYHYLYSPASKTPGSPYYEVMATADGWKQYERFDVNVFPPTDDRPFLNHFLKFGVRTLPEDTPAAFRHFSTRYADSDRVLIAILVEAAALSLVFILAPLWAFQRRGLRGPGTLRFLAYFASLGLGFILIEIALIQKYTLFVGYPSYSVTTVLFSLLVFAGTGSWLSQRYANSVRRSLSRIVPAICLVVAAELWVTPLLFDAFVGQPLPVRIAIAVVLLAPMGMLLGMPFPLGIRLAEQLAPRLIPWLWGVNGYCTVIGTVLCVILALMVGFKAVMLLACCIYVAGLIALRGLPVPER